MYIIILLSPKSTTKLLVKKNGYANDELFKNVLNSIINVSQNLQGHTAMQI